MDSGPLLNLAGTTHKQHRHKLNYHSSTPFRTGAHSYRILYMQQTSFSGA